MSKITINRKHTMAPAAVREQVQHLADKLSDQLAASYTWEQDCLVFQRKGASGHVQLHEGEVEVCLALSPLLSPLKKRIESTVTNYLDAHLV